MHINLSRLRTRMTRIARIFTDIFNPCVSAQSVFHYIPSAFICVHLRLIFVSLSDRIQEIQLKLFPIINDYQTHSCLNLLKNKPQINADKRRFVNLNTQHFSEVYPSNGLLIHRKAKLYLFPRLKRQQHHELLHRLRGYSQIRAHPRHPRNPCSIGGVQ